MLLHIVKTLILDYLADWTNSGWALDAYNTTSSGTGPSDDITGGGNYMYYETSGTSSSPITLTSLCLDVSALTNPSFSILQSYVWCYNGNFRSSC